MKDSFEKINIILQDELGVGEESAREEGRTIHQDLADAINNNTRRTRAVDQLLKTIEGDFRCKFLRAEVRIFGYGTKESEVDFYSGRMDAIAFRHTENNHLEVYVVDWKTSSEENIDWWDMAKHFKKPLYQCLLYREILKAYLKENGITARVGVMLVPIPQTGHQVIAGLCRNVEEAMDKEELLDKLKEYEWFSLKRTRFHTIKSSSNLFNLEKLTGENSRYVEERTNDLKPEQKLKQIIRDNPTVEDLCQEFGLLQLNVGCERHEEYSEAEETN